MSGELTDVLQALIVAALPGLCGGTSPPVQVGVVSSLLELDPHEGDPAAGDPRPDDQLDELSFDPAQPGGPYQLSQPPYPGPRQVRLVTAEGDRIPLLNGEVTWDATDPRRFTLQPRASRDLTDVSGVEAAYGVVSVFTKVRATRTLTVTLTAATADTAPLRQAEALVVAVIELNRDRLATDAQGSYHDGDYGALTTVKQVRLTEVTTPADGQRLLTVIAEMELKASRALGAQEGLPIVRIRTPGRPVNPSRPVDVQIDVEA
jgi:hypothetical protein